MIKLSSEQIEDAIKMANGQDIPNFSKAGTGKTHTLLEAHRLTKAQRGLVICPKIALEWWEEQAREFLGADAKVIATSSEALKGDIPIMTFNIARLRKAELYETFNGGNLIIDESHYLSNPEARQTASVFGKMAGMQGGLAECFDQVWCASGTPMTGYANDYYTQVAALHPEVFHPLGIKTYEQFCNTFTFKRQKKYHANMQPVWKISGNVGEARLHQLIYNDVGAIRRLEAPGLPKLRERTLKVSVKLDQAARNSLVKLSVDQIINKMNDPESSVGELWRIIGLAKVPEIVPYVVDSAKSSPILLGCWHRDVMAEYERELKKAKLKVVQVHGSTSEKVVHEIRHQFNAGNIDVLIGQMKKMGVSWNIQEACNHVIITEAHPTHAVVEQFYKRVYRRGQERECIVDIILSNTIVCEALESVRKSKERSDNRINH